MTGRGRTPHGEDAGDDPVVPARPADDDGGGSAPRPPAAASVAGQQDQIAEALRAGRAHPDGDDAEAPGEPPTEMPLGVRHGWASRVADNGRGAVFQDPGSTGNADMMRMMDPTPRYPYGYVRFYNSHGQPVGLDGKPGSNADTHIPREPDGSYPLPQGW